MNTMMLGQVLLLLFIGFVFVAEALSDIHRAIARTAKALRQGKPDHAGAVEAFGEGLCGISVGAASVERVVRALDGLARHLDGRGLQLEPLGKGMGVTLGVDSIRLALRERIELVKHVPTPGELAKEERQNRKRQTDIRLGRWEYGSYEQAYPEFDAVRTGALSIQIEEQYVGGLRRTWGDGKIQRLETLAEDIASGIALYLAGVKATREESERRRRCWEREQQLRALAAARAARETKRAEFVRGRVEMAKELAGLQVLLARFETTHYEPESDDLGRMIAWVQRQAAELEAQLSPAGTNSTLQQRNLFPGVDPLVDPTASDEGD